MLSPQRAFAWLLCAVCCLPAAASADGARIHWIDALPAKFASSSAEAVSGDGRVAVGSSAGRSGYVPIRWTREAGFQKLPLGSRRAVLMPSASFSGSVLLGFIPRRGSSTEEPISDGFRWSRGSGLDRLKTHPLGSYPAAINRDGSVICGSLGSGRASRAVLWIRGGEPTEIGPAALWSSANALSSDGSVVVGTLQIPGESNGEAYRWSADRGIQRLGVLAGHQSSVAWDVSADGTAVVGMSYLEAPARAFRWTAGGGMTLLTDAGRESYAVGVSGDGTRVILSVSSDFDGNNIPFLWDEAVGARPLVEVLEEYGLALPEDARLYRVTGISDDGNVLVGEGYPGHGNGPRGFHLRLPAR
jgi:uncharacterized membrane protein